MKKIYCIERKEDYISFEKTGNYYKIEISEWGIEQMVTLDKEKMIELLNFMEREVKICESKSGINV